MARLSANDCHVGYDSGLMAFHSTGLGALGILLSDGHTFGAPSACAEEKLFAASMRRKYARRAGGFSA